MPAAIEGVGVDHRRLHVAMAEELLDGMDIVAILQEVDGEGLAEGVGGDASHEACVAGRLLHRALDCALVQVMAESPAGLRGQLPSSSG